MQISKFIKMYRKRKQRTSIRRKKDYLYPIFQDEEFNYKIANKKEFNDINMMKNRMYIMKILSIYPIKSV